ncbi:MAG: transposase [Candidatus Acidiferrum sp.]
MDLKAAVPDWPHAPVHRLRDAGIYIVTAGTYDRAHRFHDSERLTYLTKSLLALADKYGWKLQAWAVFSNHYHFVAESDQPGTLRRLVRHLHSVSAKEINLRDGAPGRVVWFQYWDTLLSFQKAYLSRLNYVHTNAVRHGLVRAPGAYPWCSAGWFERSAPRSFYQTVMAFPSDRVNVPDEFEVLPIR